MAKKFKLDENWYQYERQQLAKVAKRLFENANRRIRNIRKSGLISPAYESVMATGGEFFVKGASTEELVKEIARCLTFLNSDEGATVQSARKYTKAIENAQQGLTPNESKIKWEIYSKLKQMYPTYFADKLTRRNYDSDRVLQAIENKIIEKRRSVYGGIGGDLPGFSAFKSNFQSLSNSQEQAIMQIIESIRRRIEDTVNNFIDTYDGKNLDFGFVRVHIDVDAN